MPAVPRPGQPCQSLSGDLYEVARLDLVGEQLVVGVKPHGASRWARVTSMDLATWRRLFTWPDPPS